ncbi:MAG: four helix bundle protein [Planctomycetota bacterium]
MQDHERLRVWHESRNLCVEVYRATRKFPPEERFGMQSQIRRAAISIPSNIAEGCGCASQREFARFLRISLGSANEVLSLLDIARALEFVTGKDLYRLRDRTQRVRAMLLRLIEKVTPSRPTSNVKR